MQVAWVRSAKHEGSLFCMLPALLNRIVPAHCCGGKQAGTSNRCYAHSNPRLLGPKTLPLNPKPCPSPQNPFLPGKLNWNVCSRATGCVSPASYILSRIFCLDLACLTRLA